MSLQAPKQESNYEIVPVGNHYARVYRVIHIGTIPEMYMGESKMNDKVMIGFELVNKKKVFREERGEEPFVISKEYTLSMGSKANLRKLIENMLGVALLDSEANSFDVFSIIGQPCLLNVVHQKSKKTGKEYAEIKGASPIPEGTIMPEGHNYAQKLAFGAEWSEEVFDSLPNFIKDKIKSSEQYKKMKIAGNGGYPDEELNPEDIPF